MDKIYITGAGGMVGSHLLEFFNGNREYLVYGSFFRPTVVLSEVDYGKANLFELDLRDHKKMKDTITRIMPDIIFHLAAQSLPVESWKDPYYTMDVNVSGTISLFESVLEVRKVRKDYNPKIIVITSSAIYGDALRKYSSTNLPKEDCDILPLHPYGVSKAAEDLLCYQYFKNFCLDIVRIRLFNCTGTRKTGDVTSDFVRRSIKSMRRGDDTLEVGNLNSYRTILDVRDLCSALFILSQKGIGGEAYNICSSEIFNMNYVVECIKEILGIDFKVVLNKCLFRPADEPLYAGDCSKIKALGWKQKYSYKDTISEIINYWLSKNENH